MVTHPLYTEDPYRSRVEGDQLWGCRGCAMFALHFHHYLEEVQLYLHMGNHELCQMWPIDESSEVELPARKL